LQYNNQSFYSSFGNPDYNIDSKQSQPVCDCAKTLLSSCIPYLELYAPIVKLNGPAFEVNPYGSDETGREGVIRKPKEQATLSHTCQNKSPCFQPLKNA
jgi:hypothetical protein